MRHRLCLVLLLVMAAPAKDKKEIPKAPLPSQVLTAKEVFISKGVGSTAFTVKGGFDLAFDAFYSDMKSWGRFTITDKPEDADLLMQVSYTAASGGTHVYSSTNTYTNQTTVYSSQILDLSLTLVVYDSHSRTELWSTSVEPGTARRKKNQEKEMIKAGETLVTNLRERMDISPPTAAPNNK
jgi:hypothetical protein